METLLLLLYIDFLIFHYIGIRLILNEEKRRIFGQHYSSESSIASETPYVEVAYFADRISFEESTKKGVITISVKITPENYCSTLQWSTQLHDYNDEADKMIEPEIINIGEQLTLTYF
jgi:hypothetical protein